MWESAWIFVTAITILIVGGAAAWPFLRARRAARSVQQARETFHRRREWLEARFLSLAEKSGKPRGLRWVDCEFDDHVESHRWFTASNLARGTVLDAVRGEVDVDRHLGGANYLFADGRVETISESTIAEWSRIPYAFVKPNEAAEGAYLAE